MEITDIIRGNTFLTVAISVLREPLSRVTGRFATSLDVSPPGDKDSNPIQICQNLQFYLVILIFSFVLNYLK